MGVSKVPASDSIIIWRAPTKWVNTVLPELVQPSGAEYSLPDVGIEVHDFTPMTLEQLTR
ncbi:hypothetical protein [Sphingomonas sp. ID0503]|uniref:hypothetical protein n=1 Tax=Sphingomonas sp. ID0503 TaxID=3399691 RepID=UPI003AFA71BD